MLVAKINCESLENCQEELFLVKLPTYNVETTTLLLRDFSKDSLQNMFRKVTVWQFFLALTVFTTELAILPKEELIFDLFEETVKTLINLLENL